MSRVTIRPATPLDAETVCELIVDTPGGLTDIAGSREGALRMARAVFDKSRTFFGYTRTLVADDNGHVVGEIVRVSGQEWTRFRRPTGLAMLMASRPKDVIPLVWRGRAAGRAMLPIPSDVLYVVSLCVDPERRGQGIGAALLARAVEEAAGAGLRSVALDVAPFNRDAIRFYSREGFVPLSRGDVPTPGTAVAGSMRMERPASMTTPRDVILPPCS